MAHFAKVHKETKEVLAVVVISNDIVDPEETGTDNEALGIAKCQELWGDGVSFFDMARLGVGLNRNDGRVNRVQSGPGGTLVIPALDSKMIYPIPQAETDAK